MVLFAETNFIYIESRYDKILETINDCFQYININVVFLLNKFLFYMQDNIQCLLDDNKIKDIRSFNKNDYDIFLDFVFYILLVDMIIICINFF